MTSVICIVVVLILLILGVLSCFANKIPGPLIVYIAILLMRFWGEYHIPDEILIAGAILVLISLILSYTGIPWVAKHVHRYDKAGKQGAVIGFVLGLLMFFWKPTAALACIIALPPIFAILFEIIDSRSGLEGLKRGSVAYLAFLCTTIVKLALVLIGIYYLFHFTEYYG